MKKNILILAAVAMGTVACNEKQSLEVTPSEDPITVTTQNSVNGGTTKYYDFATCSNFDDNRCGVLDEIVITPSQVVHLIDVADNNIAQDVAGYFNQPTNFDLINGHNQESGILGGAYYMKVREDLNTHIIVEFASYPIDPNAGLYGEFAIKWLK
jgi:hypothetical protein